MDLNINKIKNKTENEKIMKSISVISISFISISMNLFNMDKISIENLYKK